METNEMTGASLDAAGKGKHAPPAGVAGRSWGAFVFSWI